MPEGFLLLSGMAIIGGLLVSSTEVEDLDFKTLTKKKKTKKRIMNEVIEGNHLKNALDFIWETNASLSSQSVQTPTSAEEKWQST